jgi:hypothetical protein
MARRMDLLGRRQGRLVFTGLADIADREAHWHASCDCGKQITIRRSHVLHGQQSCGCLGRENASRANRTHGASRGDEYKVWRRIRKRCGDPTHHHYQNYGGRGIRVCEQWQASFSAFLEDVGKRPSKSHSLDRIDNDGHYEPNNVRWATPTDQARNRRNNTLISVGDRTLPIAAWAEISGLSAATISYRFHHGWTPERAVFAPLQRGN